MFSWSPPGLSHVATSSSYPSSGHLRCVTLALMESVLNPHLSPVTIFHLSCRIYPILVIFGLQSFCSIFVEHSFESSTIPSGIESVPARSTTFYYALTREVPSLPYILFPSIIIPGVSRSVTLLYSLMPLLRIPPCLNFGRLSSIELRTFIP